MTVKKVLFITKRFYTNKDVIVDRFGRNYFLPSGLAKFGYRTQVIALDYRSSQSFISNMDSVKFITIGCRGFSFFTFLFKTFYHVLAFRPHIIIGSGDSYFGFFAYFFARITKVKCFFDVYDFYPAFLSNRIPGMKWLFYQMLRRVDKVYCASKPLEALIKNYNASVFFVPNAIDPECFKPMNKTEARAALGFDQHAKYIGYFGSLAKNRGTYDLLDAFAQLLTERNNSYLVLAGRKEESIDLNKKNVIYLGTIHQSQLVSYINACDVVTLPYHEDDLIQYGNSCKTMEYIACAKPLVASKVQNFIANYFQILQIAAAQMLCEPMSVSSLKEAIDWQLEHEFVLPLDLVITWNELVEKLAFELAD